MVRSLNDALIAAGFLLMLYNLIFCCYFTLFRKEVSNELKIADKIFSIAFICLIGMFSVAYFVVLSLHLENPWVTFLLFAGSIFVTFSLQWLSRLSTSVKKRSIRITDALIGLMETRDIHMDGHSVHIERLVSVLYDYLPLNLKFTVNPENLRYAALFHDIGKLGIPEEILNKPGKLTKEEWEIMRTHPEISIEILKPIQAFEPILDWIRYHHERMDGKGYYGIDGRDIPLASRMLAIADTFSSVTVIKSYKPSRTYEDGINVLKMAAGTQLDSELVEIFCNIPKHEIEACAEDARLRIDSLTEKL